MQFERVNTNFLARDKDGNLIVVQHYTQGATVITMTMARVREVSPGVFQRDNLSGGVSRFPRNYPSPIKALRGMVAKAIQDKEFDTGQEMAVAAHDEANLARRTGAHREGYRFQMQTRDKAKAERAAKSQAA